MGWLKKWRNPVYLQQPPSYAAQWVLMLALLWVALPAMALLPLPLVLLFALLWGVRALMLKFRVTWLLANSARTSPSGGRTPAFGGRLTVGNVFLVVLIIVVCVAVKSVMGTLVGREGAVVLLLFTVLKAYETHNMRDWQVLFQAMVVAAAGVMLFQQGLLMAPWLLVTVLLLVWSLGALGGMGARSSARQAALALLLTAPVVTVLFVSVPRLDNPLWRLPTASDESAKTGLSDTMRPGSISNLVPDQSVVFTATFDNNATVRPQQLYWRVMVMAQHDGRAWHAANDFMQWAQAVPNHAAVPPEDRLRSYQIIVRDSQGRIPALDYPVAPLADRSLIFGQGDVVRVRRSRDGWRRIKLTADLDTHLARAISRGERLYYTTLPAGLNPRTRHLARQLSEQSADTEDYVNRVLQYFRSGGFRYTLQPRRNGERDSTDYFLFDSREGFCEDYADAFVWLMRAAGVTARVVTGYQGGEYDAQGRFWQVRNSDAHAWAEVWLPEKQAWQRVDPTATVSAARISSGSVVSGLPAAERGVFQPRYPQLRRFLDRSRFYWQQWVVEYDADRQTRLLQQLGLERGAGALLAAAAVLLAACIPAVFWVLRTRRHRDIMTETLMLLKHKILDGSDDELAAVGPEELRSYLKRSRCLNADLARLLDEYIALRYASRRPPSDAQQRRWSRRMRRAMKKVGR